MIVFRGRISKSLCATCEPVLTGKERTVNKRREKLRNDSQKLTASFSLSFYILFFFRASFFFVILSVLFTASALFRYYKSRASIELLLELSVETYMCTVCCSFCNEKLLFNFRFFFPGIRGRSLVRWWIFSSREFFSYLSMREIGVW